mmetsp:Transcript_32283/g.74864  ORF Transcript_32283/g.74864 Transcript_32283/m.74864 type:complete len:246 (+) Transcript_32283:1317-2054(+)
MRAPWTPLSKSIAKRKPQFAKTSCCGEACAKTWSKCQLRMPMPGDTVSTDPCCPDVTESTEATKPGRPSTLPPSGDLSEEEEEEEVLEPPSTRCMSWRIASLCVRFGFCRLSSAMRWCSGSETSVLAASSGSAPTTFAAGGRMRQNAAKRKFMGAAHSAAPPETTHAPSGTKRLRNGHSSWNRARQPPSPFPRSPATSFAFGTCKSASSQRHSQSHRHRKHCTSAFRTRERLVRARARWDHGRKR